MGYFNLICVLALTFACVLGADSVANPVRGKAYGFAEPATGGGNVAPVTPTTIEELKTLLGHKDPKVIILDREFDFRKSEGVATRKGCHPNAWNCSSSNGGQDALDEYGWCKGAVTYKNLTFDVAGHQGIPVAPNKSLVGIGNKGILRGKGLWIDKSSNVIVQNILITDINPSIIFAGDGIQINGGDLVWIDRVTFSWIARSHLVMGPARSSRVTISNNFFDGKTKYTPSCDGHHYWAILLEGLGSRISFVNNTLSTLSGRAPRLDGPKLHALDNKWTDNTGHAFDIAPSSSAVLEGNSFNDVKWPLLHQASSDVFFADSSNLGDCKQFLNRPCTTNTLKNSGAFPHTNGQSFSTGMFADVSNSDVPEESDGSSTPLPAPAPHPHAAPKPGPKPKPGSKPPVKPAPQPEGNPPPKKPAPKEPSPAPKEPTPAPAPHPNKPPAHKPPKKPSPPSGEPSSDPASDTPDDSVGDSSVNPPTNPPSDQSVDGTSEDINDDSSGVSNDDSGDSSRRRMLQRFERRLARSI